MSKVILKKLVLVNFKKHKNLEIDFHPEHTIILKPNRWGKTTVYDAFCFLINGTDSTGRTDFGIKPNDLDGNNISNGAEHSVLAVFECNGFEVSYKRIVKEEWVKPRGEEHSKLKGHKTSYEIDGTPVDTSASFLESLNRQFNTKLFRVLTDVYYFHSKAVSHDQRREIILSLITNRSEIDIVAQSDIEDVVKQYIINLLSENENNTLESIYKKCEASQAPIKKTLKENPIRIDELNKSIAKMSDIDFDSLEQEKTSLELELSAVEKSINDTALRDEKSNDNVKGLMDKRNKLTLEISKLEGQRISENFKIKSEAETKEKTAKRNYDNHISSIKDEESDLQDLKLKLTENESKRNELREEFYSNRDKSTVVELDLSETSCPTCSRDFDVEVIQKVKSEKESELIRLKAEALKSINERGVNLKNNTERLQKEINAKTELINKLKSETPLIEQRLKIAQSELKEAENKVEQNVASKEEKDLIKEKESIVIPEQIKTDVSEYIAKKEEINKKITSLNEQISSKSVLNDANQRLKELSEESAKLSSKLAQQEKLQFSLNKIDRKKIDLVQNDINSLFSMAKFNFFKEQMNGGSNDICLASFNGTSYPDLNDEAKINIGLDIINVLSQHYNTYLPVFVDRRESVNQLIETSNLQIISLIAPSPNELNSNSDNSSLKIIS